MLILTRRRNETIEIDGGRIKVVVVELKGSSVRLGIEAAKDISVHRGEVAEAIRREQLETVAQSKGGVPA